MLRLTAIALLMALTTPASPQVTLSEGTNFALDAASDGRIAIDLLGTIWIVPPDGGAAEAIQTGGLRARRPRWSPDGAAILFQAQAETDGQVWLYRFADGEVGKLSEGGYFDQHPAWHPDGERIVYSSARHGGGFDLWELDLATRLTWRISHSDGDELEPAWSANGRDLLFVHRLKDRWSVVLRRLGEPDRALVTSGERLSAPQWRPDGTLVTFLRHGAERMSIDMAILSEPLLVRPLISDEDFFAAPVAWLDRQQFVYPANGVIRKREFNAWSSTDVPFQITLSGSGAPVAGAPRRRELPVIDPPAGQLVLRTTRLFDGIGGGYKSNLDIVIDAGRISALEERRERPGSILVDLGDLTAMPGFIDAYAALPDEVDAALGPLLLSFGVTTLVADHPAGDELNRRWSGKTMPGPRVLRASDIAAADATGPAPWLLTIGGDLASGIATRDATRQWLDKGVPVLAASWQLALASGATMILGADSLPSSPRGERYADLQLAHDRTPVTLVSGLADSNTPGLADLLSVRQAELLALQPAPRRFADSPGLPSNGTGIVLGSRPNGLPPGLALHAEFRALAAAGLDPEKVIQSAGVNAAGALGLGLAVGRLAPGSVADIVIVDGDPLAKSQDLLKVVGVVRNGRFYSAIGLIEQARTALGVE